MTLILFLWHFLCSYDTFCVHAALFMLLLHFFVPTTLFCVPAALFMFLRPFFEFLLHFLCSVEKNKQLFRRFEAPNIAAVPPTPHNTP